MSESAARERIVETASELFYQYGINNVGIDLVIARSGVAKMTLYRHFRSKDDLVLAVLAKINHDLFAWLRARVAASRVRARNRPLAVFDALEEWFGTKEFRGCPFINTAAQLNNPGHRIHRAAWGYQQNLRGLFLELLREAGHREAPSLADQLLLLADGAIVRAAMEGDSGAARPARRAAARLLED